MRWTADGDGPLVVKLAGAAGGVELYREECEAAVAAGFRVARVDTSGDRSDDPAPGRLSWDSISADVRRAIDELGNERAILWGTSYGSLVALAAAARYPGRVSGLLLAVPPDPAALPAWFSKALDWAETFSNPDRVMRVFLSLSLAVFTGWELKYRGLRERAAALTRASREAATPSSTVSDKLRLLWRESPGLPPPGLWPRTSIIAARRDYIAPYSGARKLAVRMTGSRLVTLDVGGHAVAWSHPAIYHAAAIEELRRITAATP